MEKALVPASWKLPFPRGCGQPGEEGQKGRPGGEGAPEETGRDRDVVPMPSGLGCSGNSEALLQEGLPSPVPGRAGTRGPLPMFEGTVKGSVLGVALGSRSVLEEK